MAVLGHFLIFNSASQRGYKILAAYHTVYLYNQAEFTLKLNWINFYDIWGRVCLCREESIGLI